MTSGFESVHTPSGSLSEGEVTGLLGKCAAPAVSWESKELDRKQGRGWCRGLSECGECTMKYVKCLVPRLVLLFLLWAFRNFGMVILQGLSAPLYPV